LQKLIFPIYNHYILNIKSSGNIIWKTVSDISDIIKIETNLLSLDEKLFKLSDLFNDINIFFSSPFKRKNINLIFNIDESLPQYVYADYEKLKQIFFNLLNNALKYTPSGNVTIDVLKINENNETVTIKNSVSDDGIGMSQENIDNFINNNNKLNETKGLGLYVIKHLLKIMNSYITYTPKTNGTGSIFSFTITLKKEISSTKQEILDKLKNMNISILIASSNEKSNIIVNTLKNIGCDTSTVKNGIELLQKFLPYKYDLIFVDCKMPLLDGVTAICEIHSIYNKNEIPVIIGICYDSKPDDIEVQKYMSKSMDEVILGDVNSDIIYNFVLKYKDKIYNYKNYKNNS